MTDFPWGIIYERPGGPKDGDRTTWQDNRHYAHHEAGSARLADAVSRYLMEREAA